MHPGGTSIIVRAAILAVAVLVRTPAGADVLPPLPLPACMSPTLPAVDGVVCEGSRVTLLNNPPGLVGPPSGSVGLAISTRNVDFRLDADLGSSQVITFTYTLPPVAEDPGPSGSTYRSAIRIEWPDVIAEGSAVGGGTSGVSCLKSETSGFQNQCDGAPIPGSPNGGYLLERQDPCPASQASCAYRLTWSAYDRPGATRTRQAAIYRVGFSYDLVYVRQLMDGGFDPQCGSDLATSGCLAGGGAAYVAFRSDPPPPLTAIGTAKRLGAKRYEFDGSTSTPDVVTWTWQLSPQHVYPGPVLVHDFALDDPPITIAGSTALLEVADRWLRRATTGVAYTLLAPGGTEGPLEILSFELVGVDENGLATLKAVVKNTTDDEIEGVFLLGDAPFATALQATPDGVTIAGGESVEFTVTFQFGISDTVTTTVQAFGTATNGPVKSGETFRKVERDPGPPPTATTVSAPSAAGATILQVASTGGFAPGDYVVVNPGGITEEVRRIEALGSLIFAAPLAHPHAIGEIVGEIPAPLGDVTPPTITVTSPLPGGSVCQDAALTATFTCEDAGGVGVEECGDDVASGAPLDTATSGPRELVLRAWDANGNAATKTVGYTVGFCSTVVDAFRCYQAKPAKGAPKFTPVTGVRVTHAFTDVVVDLKKPQLLCAPADTTGDGFIDAETHLEAYAIAPQKGQPKPVAQPNLAFVTQLGTFAVDVKKPAQLALPTAEDGGAPPAVVGTDVDRFTCYAAKLAKGQPKLPKALELTVTDQFTSPPLRAGVKKLARLCVPTGANGGPAKHDEHLLCFQVTRTKGRCADAAPINAGGGCKKEPDCGGDKTTSLCVTQAKFAKRAARQVANELDAGSLDLAKDDVLCLPALPPGS